MEVYMAICDPLCVCGHFKTEHHKGCKYCECTKFIEDVDLEDMLFEGNEDDDEDSAL